MLQINMCAWVVKLPGTNDKHATNKNSLLAGTKMCQAQNQLSINTHSCKLHLNCRNVVIEVNYSVQALMIKCSDQTVTVQYLHKNLASIYTWKVLLL